MKKVFLISLIAIIAYSSFGGNSLYLTFNQSYVVQNPNETNYHNLQIWEFDKESMTVTFFDTMKSFPITSWEDKEENEKLIIVNIGEYSLEIIINSPWVMAVFFWQNNEDETYSYLYTQVFYLEKLPDWYFVSGDEKDSYWNW